MHKTLTYAQFINLCKYKQIKIEYKQMKYFSGHLKEYRSNVIN